MTRKAVAAEAPEDVPKWFMTYSDVITLLMTFFILLLTFATNEPERFEKMKKSMFGSSGATGLVGDRPEGTEKDSWLVRVRPRRSRLTSRGAEVPPIDKDQPQRSLDNGLAGLEADKERQVVEVIQIVVPAHHFATPDGQLYDYGVHNLKMLARMLHRRAYEVTFEVSAESQLPRALACMQFLFHDQKIGADRLAVVEDAEFNIDREQMRMILKSYQGQTNVQTQEATAK